VALEREGLRQAVDEKPAGNFEKLENDESGREVA